MDPIEAYLRQGAIQRGMDPDQAVRVVRSEGGFGPMSYVGDQGSSFGPFQLHYGGVAPGGNAVSGLGDEFTKQTGLDARDPNTVHAQIDFALDHAKQNGWGAWHGWKGDPWAGIKAQAPMQAAMNERQPMPNNNTPVLFGGNPTPVGLLGGLARTLGVGSEDDLGRRLQSGAAGLMAVGTAGLQGGGMGASNFSAIANQPHYDVVTDALGNRYILDKRTGAISMPAASGLSNSNAPSSGDPAVDTVANSPLGAVDRAKAMQDQSVKQKAELEDAATNARMLSSLAERQMELSKNPGVIQGPGLWNDVKEKLGENTNGTIGGMDVAAQKEFDTNNNQIIALMGKDMLNNARIAGPEINFMKMAKPSKENPAETNQSLYAQIKQRADRIGAHAEIARKYPVLGSSYNDEIQAYDKANPIYQGPSNNSQQPNYETRQLDGKTYHRIGNKWYQE